jgi:hypothetical protein
VIALAAAGYAWMAAGLRPFTLAQELAVAVPAALVVGLAAWLAGREPPTDAGDRVPTRAWRASAAVWLGLVVLAFGWQLVAYFSSPRSAHPTLSVLVEDVMSTHAGRAAVFLAWLALGLFVATSTRATRR